MKPVNTGKVESAKFPRMSPSRHERRKHHRHDMESQGITVQRFDGHSRSAAPLGKIVDLSAGGVRIRATKAAIRPDQQIRVKLVLPEYAGISPFISPSSGGLEPKPDWVGWMTVCRVIKAEGDQVEVAGRLVDMDEMDRGMLGLYLSTQPLAA
ncbi:MAG TPA: PilZ domain-containing protein [Tepidisphaeraceae bacterium]|nr:PilZ domain-containing protein [Tepidisphaeraceae bacterium]